MNQGTVKEKIFNIEGELEFLKRSILREPNFDIDKKNWDKIIRTKVKKARKEVYRKFYEER